MQENKPGLRLETQQQLTEKAQLIEEAKRIANALRNNPLETRIWKLKNMFPTLSEQEIKEIAQ